jgi:hypothetical protein
MIELKFDHTLLDHYITCDEKVYRYELSSFPIEQLIYNTV